MKRTFINKVILSPADRNCSGSQPCKKRDPEQQRLRMTGTMSSRSVSTPVIPQCLYAGYRSFLLRPILRIETLRNDEAAGVRGFTLVELLVVVLIIGILSAIAIPMYQGAVDKSHWSTMLPASKAIKDAEEAFKMTNGEYSDTMEHLDVQMNNSDLQFDLQTPNNLSQPNVIKVTNSKLGDRVRLASYLDDSPLFAGQLHCEAKNEGSTPNERGQRLCEKLLNGQKLNTDDGYTRYLLNQSIDQSTCGAAELAWAQTTSKCYQSKEERCSDLNMTYYGTSGVPAIGGSYNIPGVTCGYGGWDAYNKPGLIIDEGGVCYPARSIGGCNDDVFQNGGICLGKEEAGCHGGTYTNGSACVSNSNYSHERCTGGTYDNSVCFSTNYSCSGNNFTNNSVCYGYYCSNGTYDDTSCCCGNCGDKPKCSADRCAEVKAQYEPYLK